MSSSFELLKILEALANSPALRRRSRKKKKKKPRIEQIQQRLSKRAESIPPQHDKDADSETGLTPGTKQQTPWIRVTNQKLTIDTPAERPHSYEHVDAITGCRICARGPGFYIHKLLPGPRGHGVSTGTRSSENKIYRESKLRREQLHASFTRKVIRRSKRLK